jgi:hypothetical protein
MSTFNYGNEYKTLVAKGSIKAGAYVTVSHHGDFHSWCMVTDRKGDKERYESNELQSFGVVKYSNRMFDIASDYYANKTKDEFGNADMVTGYEHITANVRSGLNRYKFGDDCLYCNKFLPNVIGYKYDYRELTDDDAVRMLLDDILYGAQPNLQSMSCVGTTERGLDKDPNYRDGHYLLPNGKEYTMSWCGSTVKIREGRDGGWYHDSKTCGKTIYEGIIDWARLKEAIVRVNAANMLRRGIALFDDFPMIADILKDSIREQERFKLSSEF